MRSNELELQPVVTMPINHWLFGGPSSHLCCPVCGFNYVHIASVTVDQGHVFVESSEDQVHVRGTRRHQFDRGSAATLGFWCESGHWFQYEFHFYKGNTFVDLHTAKIDNLEKQRELWRN